MGSDKVILLTDNKRLYQALQPEIKKKNLTIENSIKDISDLNYIKSLINITKSTKFIREGFSKFIKENKSTPFATIIDYRINIDKDNPRAKATFPLCRTFLITAAILDKMPDLEYNKYNFILIGYPTDLKIFEIFHSYPHMIFKNLIKILPNLSKILNKYAENPEYTQSLFYFDYLIIDNVNNDITPALTKFEKIINKLNEKKIKEKNMERAKDQTPLMQGNFEPAKIMYKISNARVYIDGKIYNIENNPKFNKYKENIIYIVGHFVNTTVKDVSQKLEKFIINDLPKIKKVTPDMPLYISVNSHTIVDGATAPNLSVFLGTKLSQFKNIKILTSKDNLSKFEKSPGFITLKKYIQIEK